MFSTTPIRSQLLALVAVLFILSLTVSASSNHNLQHPRRRHHSKPARRLSPAHSTHSDTKVNATKELDLDSVFKKIKRDECEYGSWRCLGLELQRCFGGTFNTLRTCSTEGMVCSTDPSQTGCIWSWQASSSSSSSGGTASMGTVLAAIGAESQVGVGATISSTVAASVSSATETGETSTVQVASSTISIAPWYTAGFTSTGTSSSATSTSTWSVTATSSSTGTASATATATGSPELGEQLALTDGSTWAESASSTGWTDSSSSTGTGTGTVTSQSSASATTSASSESIDVWGSWTHKKAKHHHTSSSSSSAWASTESETASTETQSATITTSSDPWTATTTIGTASVSHNLSALVPTASSTPSPALGSSAHYVIYSDAWLVDMPLTSAVQGYNKFILAFWLSDKGAADNAAFWQSLSGDEQKTVVKAYKDAGITLMVSAFGSTDHPITDGRDPTEVAQALATWVIDNNMAGVDIDLEDDTAMNNGQFIDWVVTFQKELRKQLPEPYLISHAPQAPWFTSADKWGGGYVKIHQECGDGIDFYNIQYYNQGDDQYNTCENLLFNSGSSFPDSSVFQTNTVGGVPLEKLVIGKPINAGAAANGYMDSATLNGCVNQAKAKGWNAGIMYWEYDSTAVGTILAVVG